MKRFIAVLVLAVAFAAVSFGQVSRERFNLIESSPVSATPSYADAVRRSLAENKPVVIWVSTFGVEAPGFIEYRTRTFEDVEGAGVVVGVPIDGHMYRGDLPVSATFTDIQREVQRVRDEVRTWNAPRPTTTITPTQPFFSAPSFFRGGGGGSC